MSVKIKLKHSSVANKAPQPADLDTGELALNVNSASPAAYLKDSAGAIVKIAGAGAIGGTPATETAAGIVELATAAETTTGTDNTRAVHPAGLKVELDKKAPLASPALTGVPTAPTAAAGTNTTQLATTEFVTAAVAVENLWDRTGTVVSPTTAGDTVQISAGTAALPGLTPVGDPNTGVFSPGADQIAIGTKGSERARIDSSGRLLVGTSSTSDEVSLLLQGNSTNAAYASVLNLCRGATPSSIEGPLGVIDFSDNGHVGAARISGTRDGGTWTSGSSQPSALTFSTTADGESAPTERMRVGSDGSVFLGNTSAKPAIPVYQMTVKANGIVNLANAPTYADNTAAKAGGLVAGDVYRTATGQLMITF